MIKIVIIDILPIGLLLIVKLRKKKLKKKKTFLRFGSLNLKKVAVKGN
jgi:hypothetical protein